MVFLHVDTQHFATIYSCGPQVYWSFTHPISSWAIPMVPGHCRHHLQVGLWALRRGALWALRDVRGALGAAAGQGMR